jgi:hypothetical protein
MPLRRTHVCTLLGALAVFAAPAAAPAATAPWATVNVCDTAAHPNTIGLRGSMPGTGSAGEMFMRLQVQYQRDDGTWRLLGNAGDSGFIDVGHSRTHATRQAGHSFTLRPPAAGNVYTLRGLATFEWRTKNGAVIRRARRRTTGGHRSTAGADPAGFSAAECTITA